MLARAPAGPPVVSTRTHGCRTAVCSQRRVRRADPSRDEATRRLQRDSTAAGMASTAWSDSIAPLPLYLSFFLPHPCCHCGSQTTTPPTSPYTTKTGDVEGALSSLTATPHCCVAYP